MNRFTITDNNNKIINFEDMANRILQSNGLIQSVYFHSGYACALGEIFNPSHEFLPLMEEEIKLEKKIYSIMGKNLMILNDTFTGTPEQRKLFIASLLNQFYWRGY